MLATRMGDAPSGVTVADPAAVTAAPSTSAPAPAVAGPILDGTFRVDFDWPNQTHNGNKTHGNLPPKTHWWAFRSFCAPSGCVATSAELAQENQQEATGEAQVFSISPTVAGRTPHTWVSGVQCAGATDQKASDTQTFGWTLAATARRHASRRYHRHRPHERMRESGRCVANAVCSDPDRRCPTGHSRRRSGAVLGDATYRCDRQRR